MKTLIEENLKAIKRWKRPDSYIQWDYDKINLNEYFVFLGQNRGSDILELSNFICGLNAIGKESKTVLIRRESHWAFGWVELILIHESNVEAIEKADEILCCLEDYPILDDEHFSTLEYDEAIDFWESLEKWERLELVKNNRLSLNENSTLKELLNTFRDGETVAIYDIREILR